MNEINSSCSVAIPIAEKQSNKRKRYSVTWSEEVEDKERVKAINRPGFELLRDLGGRALGSRQYDLAIKHFEAAVDYSVNLDEKAPLYHKLGSAYMRQGRNEEAIAALTRGLHRSDKQRKHYAYTMLGYCYSSLNQNELAVDAWNRALRGKFVDPDQRPVILKNLGFALKDLGRDQAAKNMWNLAMRCEKISEAQRRECQRALEQVSHSALFP